MIWRDPSKKKSRGLERDDGEQFAIGFPAREPGVAVHEGLDARRRTFEGADPGASGRVKRADVAHFAGRAAQGHALDPVERGARSEMRVVDADPEVRRDRLA